MNRSVTYLRAQALLLLPELGCELGTEVVRLEHLANLDISLLGMGIGAPLDPFDRLFLRLHLAQAIRIRIEIDMKETILFIEAPPLKICSAPIYCLPAVGRGANESTSPDPT